MNNKVKNILTIIFAFSAFTYMQAENISGRILNEDGQPERNARVTLKADPSVKTITDENGNFSLEASIGDYIRIETADNKKRSAKVSENELIVELNSLLDKMIVTSNELSVSSLEKTSSIAVISSDEIMKSSAYNPANALYGKGLGLTALQNNESSATLYIRGLNNLGSNTPLILVDGFERPLNMIAPEEIESIQILKDAAATAIYGLRGSNGVVLATTKKGLYNTRKISISYDHAFNKALNLPKFVNAQTYAKSVNEAMLHDKSSSLRYNDYEIEAFGSGASPYYANVDWVGELLKNTGSSNIYNLNFQGGGETSRYYSSINLIDNSGYVKPDNEIPQFSSQRKFSQFNARINLDLDLTKTTELTIKVGGIIQAYNLPAYTGEGIMTLLYSTPSAAFPVKTQSGNYGASNVWDKNPLAEITARGYNSINDRTLLADIGVTQRLDLLTEGLSISARMGLDTYAEYLEGQNQDYMTEVNSVLFDALGSPSEVVTNLVGKNTTPSRYKYMGNQWRTYNFTAQADYDRYFNKSHLKAMIFINTDQASNVYQHNTRNRMRIGANIHYGFDDKYFVEGTFVAHGSNLLPKGNRFGYFPALSGAWVMSKESFLQEIDFLNLLKLRASAGITGYDWLPNGAHNITEELYGGRNGFYFGSGSGYAGGLGELRLPSNTSTYAKTYKYNVGFDTRLFNAVDVTFEAFLEKSRDMLVSTYGSISGTTGLTPLGTTGYLPFDNIGAVDNKGIELGINLNKKFGEVAVLAGGNFTFTRNKIVEMGEGYYPNDAAKLTGKSIGQLIGFQTIGIFKDDAEIAASPLQTLYPVVPGDLKFADTYGNDNVIDTYDRQALGYSNMIPEIYYSFNFGAEYKGVGIDMQFQGVGNYSALLLNNGLYLPLVGNTNLSQHYYDNRWTPDNLDAQYPRLTMNANTNNYSTNSTWVADASYLKLRHCEAYYKLPKQWISSIGLENVKLYLRGMDLFSINNIKEIDVEMINSGKMYPSTMSVNIGAKIDF